MNALHLSRRQLGLLGHVVGDVRGIAALVVRAITSGGDLDLQIERAGKTFTLVARELRGEEIVSEVTMPIAWDRLGEATRFAILELYVGELALSAVRTRRRAELTVASIVRPK